MTSKRLKLCVIGPIQSGKTKIVNYISQNFPTEEIPIDGLYIPTGSCRIIQTAIDGIRLELWDCSGKHEYENCWDSIAHEADGLILVYDPNNPSHDSEIIFWYETFMKICVGKKQDNGIDCFVIMNTTKNSNIEESVPHVAFQSHSICKMNHFMGQYLKDKFSKFVVQLAQKQGLNANK